MNTRHAAVRAQQRGIPPLISQWLDDYGEAIYDGRGAIQLVFTRKSMRQMEREFGREPMRRMHEYMHAYKVVDSHNGQCITIGHRYKHIRRK